MKDEYFAELISRRLDGDLTKEEQDELYAHLADCPECRKLAEDMLFISSLADESMVEPPDTLSASVMRSVKADKSRRKRLIPGLSGVLAASVAVVLLVRGGYFSGQNETGIPDLNNISMQVGITEDAAVDEDASPALGSSGYQANDLLTEGAADESDEPAAYFGDTVAGASVSDLSTPAESASDAGVETARATEPTFAASEPTAAPTVDATSDSEALPEYFMAANAIAEGADTSEQGVDAVATPRAYVTQSEQPVENTNLKMALMSAPASPDIASNSLNVSANRLNIDLNDMVAVSYNGNRVALGDPGFSDITGQVLGYLTTIELSESADAPSTTTEYVVEYADGHSETLLYSADGYLNCNGVWYTLDAPAE